MPGRTNWTISLSLDDSNQVGTQITLCRHLTLLLYDNYTRLRKVTAEFQRVLGKQGRGVEGGRGERTHADSRIRRPRR